MKNENYPEGPYTCWPTHWAGGWGIHTIEPNRIRIQSKDGRVLAYMEHHTGSFGSDLFPATDRGIVERHIIHSTAVKVAQEARIAQVAQR